MGRKKVKDMRQIVNPKGTSEFRDVKVNWKLALSVRTVNKEIWKGRTYPNPYDKDEQLPFKSEQEYVEYCLRALNKCGKTSWFWFSHLLNPNFPQD